MPELEPLEILQDPLFHYTFKKVTGFKFPSPVPEDPYDEVYNNIHRLSDPILAVPLTFGGSELGSFGLHPVTAEFVEDGEFETPLGRVRYYDEVEHGYYKNTGGEILAEESVRIVHEAPLVVAISVNVGDFLTYQNLKRYKAILNLSTDHYSLAIIHPVDEDADVDDYFRKNNKPLVCYSWNVLRMNGERGDFAIPGRPDTVQKVGIGFRPTNPHD